MLSTTIKGGISFGVRDASVWVNFLNNIENNIKEDREVNIWLEGLKRDPIVKLTTGIASELKFYGNVTLNASTSILKTAAYPITLPFSKIFSKPKYVLTECPFPLTENVESTESEIALRKLNIFEKLLVQ